MNGLPQDAGFSLLEVLVVLAIAALAATGVTAAILQPRAEGLRWATELSHFLREARGTALRTGAPVVVSLSGGKAQAGNASLAWPPPAATYRPSGPESSAALLLLDGAGAVIAGPTAVTRAGQSWDVSRLLGSTGP